MQNCTLCTIRGLPIIATAAIAAGTRRYGPEKASSASCVAVYVTSTAAGVRLLHGAARVAAGIAFAAVVVVLEVVVADLAATSA